jgi:hypothetical protein
MIQEQVESAIMGILSRGHTIVKVLMSPGANAALNRAYFVEHKEGAEKYITELGGAPVVITPAIPGEMVQITARNNQNGMEYVHYERGV